MTASPCYAMPLSPDEPLLLLGDCLDVLARLPAESVDVVIADPPAGIGFMAKPWDSFASYQPRTPKGRDIAARLGADELIRRAANLLLGLALSERTEGLPAREDAAALAAELRERAKAPAPLPPWAVGFVAFMVDVWSEVDRVLKPGGWVCSWALPKTADLAGLALRAVGWDVHDSLLHLFGQGMAKAGDLGKRIDAMRSEDPRMRVWCRWLRSVMDERQAKSSAIAERFGFNARMVDHWAARDTDSQPSMPRLDQIPTLLDALGIEELPDEMREIASALNAAKGQPGEAWWRREVVSVRTDAATAAGSRTVPLLTGPGVIVDSLPATPEAERWTDWSSQLAPGHEQWLLARKPTRLTYARQVLTHGCGALNIGACRVPRGADEHAAKVEWHAKYGERDYSHGEGIRAEQGFDHAKVSAPHPGGSWPKNVVLSEGGEGCPVAELDRQSGQQQNGKLEPHHHMRASENLSMSGPNQERHAKRASPGDAGGASRYFTRFRYQAKNDDRGAGLRTDVRNEHPTPKSVELMRWLVALLAAKAEHTGELPAVVLDPFLGSGSTGVACVAERVRFVGIERDASSFEVARSRILAAIGSPEHAAEANEVAPAGAQLSLL